MAAFAEVLRVLSLVALLSACLAQQDFTQAQIPNPFQIGDSFPGRTEVQVCRAIEDRIERNSQRFASQLVTNTNPDITFATADARIMSSRLLSRLNNLEQRFDRRMTVLKAWTPFPDPDLSADPNSLHYEGRTVSVTINGGSTSDYQRLLTTAVDAQFDWVFYERSNRVRLSVIPSSCDRNIDVVFVLDQSGSVGLTNHGLALEFLSNVASFFTIGRQNTRVGFVGYSASPRIAFDLNRYTNLNGLMNAIEDVSYTGGGTRTDRALDTTRDLLNPNRGFGARPYSEGIPKIAILITDGRSNSDPGDAAERLRRDGVQVYSIGVGRIDLNELRDISSDPDDEHVFFLSSYRDALAFVDFLSVTTCESQAVVGTCATTTSIVAQDTLQYFQSTCSDFTDSVRVQLQDLSGTTFLHCSGTTPNPGPLTLQTESDTRTGVTNRECVVNPGDLQTVYIGVQGQLTTTNEFSLVVSDNILTQGLVAASVIEGAAYELNLRNFLRSSAAGQSWTFTIADGNVGNVFEIFDNRLFRIRSSAQSSISFNNRPRYDIQILIRRPNSACSCSQFRIQLDIISSVVTFVANDASVDEGLPRLERVTDIRATSGAGSIQYSIIAGNDGDSFRIGQFTGNVRTDKVLNFETQDTYTLTIRAQVIDTTVEDTVDVVITVNDINELPFFTTPCAVAGRCVFNIDENLGGNIQVGTINADDPDRQDVPNGQLAYRIIPTSAPFSALGSGAIRSTRSLDHEAAASHSFTVEVTDGTAQITTAVIVNVNDLNDNPPMIFGESTIRVNENTPPGSPVAQYSSSDADSLAVNTEVSFSLTTTFSGTLPFEINPTDGSLVVTAAIDYEQVQRYTITVTATNTRAGSNGQTFADSITSTIEIMNLNDNRPVFLNTPYLFSIEENDMPAGAVFTVMGEDGDLGPEGDLIYAITGGNIGSIFQIDSDSGEITVMQEVDREAIAGFQLRVRASDMGASVQRRTVTINIAVDDINDLTPVFTPSSYPISIRENAPLDEVFRVFALDNDATAPNNVIRYAIEAGNEDMNFEIDPITGAVSLIASLDFESSPSYLLNISATDQGSSPRSSTAEAAITVVDVNDVPPTTVSSVNISLPESTPFPSLVVDYDAMDADSTVFFSFGTGNEENKFEINSASGIVTLEAALDYETTQRYQLEVIVSDGELQTTSTLTVDVIDENDNAPIFSSPTQFEVLEEREGGTLIGTVVATDNDLEPPNNAVTYEFAQDTPITNYVSLHSVTGQLRTIGRLDREGLEEVFAPPASTQTVRIVARDGGESPQQAFQTITIKLVDVNDNSPVFGDASYSNSLMENLQMNPQTVFQLTATDLDLGENGEIEYNFTSNPSSSAFTIDSMTGLVTVVEPLDCEAQSSYTFTLTAMDRGMPAQTSTVQGILNVIDVNDNAPIFTEDPYMFDVSESAASGERIAEVNAMDADKGLNSEIEYSVINQNIVVVTGEDETDVAPFVEIDPMSGEITLTTAFNFELQQDYNVTVVARDMGIPRMSSTTLVVFNIQNVDEFPPIFPEQCRFNIPENTSVGVPIPEIQCTATDDDNIATSPSQPLVRYSIIPNGHPVFAIDTDTGEFSLQTPLDRETVPEYTFQIQGLDLSNLPSFREVVITVDDVNDNSPVFQGTPYHYDFTIERIRSQTSSFMTLLATDSDLGENSAVTYSITNTEITSTNAAVIEVTATDDGSPPRSTTTQVTIAFVEEGCLLQQYTIDSVSGELSAALLCSVGISPAAVNVTLGQNQLFQCDVLYNGELTYQWIHNGAFVTSQIVSQVAVTQVDYTITNARFSDGGEYACKVSTEAGSLQSTTGAATIQVRPMITVPPRSQAARAGERVVFRCIAVGLPEPSVQWRRPDGTMVSGSVLEIDSVSPRDAGIYTCTASNSLTADTTATARARLTLYNPGNVIRILLGAISRPSEDGTCHHIDYNSIISIVERLTQQTALITRVLGDDICPVTPCSPSPCENDGTCSLNDRSPGGYECSCLNGYTGQNCEEDVLECDESPCENGAECTELFGMFTCDCLTGFYGHRCQLERTCSTNDTCSQTDTCLDVPGGGIACIPTPDSSTALTVRATGVMPGFLEDEVQRYIDQQLQSQTIRRKRQTNVVTTCQPRFIRLSEPDLYFLVWLCQGGDTPPTPVEVSLFCPVLLERRAVDTCTPPGGAETMLTQPPPLPDASAALDLVVIRATSSTPLSGDLIATALERIGARDEIERASGAMVTGVEASVAAGPDPAGTQAPVAVNPEAGIVIGSLILVVLAVGLAIAIVVGVVKYKQHLERQKQKRDLAVEKAVSMYSLNNFGDESANRAVVLKSTKSMSSTADLMDNGSQASISPVHRSGGEVISNDIAVDVEPC